MQLTLAAGFVPFSSVLNTVLVLSVVRGRAGGRTGVRRAGRAEGGWPLLLLLGENAAFYIVIALSRGRLERNPLL